MSLTDSFNSSCFVLLREKSKASWEVALGNTFDDFKGIEEFGFKTPDMLCWYSSLANWYDCKLSIFLCSLSWATKFPGVLVSMSLEIQVFLTEWLLVLEPGN